MNSVYNILSQSPIEMASDRGRVLQMFVRQPTPFIAQNLERVLPDWNLPIAWVVLVLQEARFPLEDTSSHVEREKDRLREKFMRFGFQVAFDLRDRGWLTDLIDPRTGYPLLSRPGEIRHDDAAVVRTMLDFPVKTNRCRVLIHPDWGTAIYPATLITSATPDAIGPLLESVARQHGWHDLAKVGDLSS